MNIIIIKGRLCASPELRYTKSGTPVCTLSVAVDRGYGDYKATDFFSCVFWKQSAEFVNQYFQKGQEILVHGEMQSRDWTDRDGNKRRSWEIGNAHAEFCGSKADNQQGYQNQSQSQPEFNPGEFAEVGDNEELPF